MNLNDQVCSLELAKRLKELGIKQESLFFWSKLSIQTEYKLELRRHMQTQELILADCTDYISAFTVSELGELLPNKILIEANAPFDCFAIYITKFNSVDEKSIITNNYIVNYECDSTPAEGIDAWLRRKLTSNFYDKNLADAMAKMLIHLLENGLIKNDS